MPCALYSLSYTQVPDGMAGTVPALICIVPGKAKQDATLSQGVPRDAAVNFGATGIIGVATILKTRCHGIVHAVSK